MPIKIDRNCSRCRRPDPIEVTSAADAVAAEELQKQRAAKAAEVTAYLEAIPAELRPDLIAYVQGRGIVHTNLCNPADAKRACLKRVTDLVDSMDELDERKPRAKKPKAAEVATVTAPAAQA